jgi:hypothetical protein
MMRVILAIKNAFDFSRPTVINVLIGNLSKLLPQQYTWANNATAT